MNDDAYGRLLLTRDDGELGSHPEDVVHVAPDYPLEPPIWESLSAQRVVPVWAQA